uniref:G-protein coupled receptors family 1 profile domain-containing protein n=1 Tax=Panagrolaimus sp. JU765 TaxID=591449 RepID=A0AC34QHB6_9BILA
MTLGEFLSCTLVIYVEPLLKICIFAIVTLAISLNIIRFWELETNEFGNIQVSAIRYHIWYKIIQEGVIYGIIVYGFPALVLLSFNINTLKLIKLDQRNRCRLSSENRTALMTVFVFIIFVLCTTMAASIRLVIILAGNLFISKEYIWLVDLSNLLMNINALIMPIVCFIFTRGFRDLFFIVRYAPSGSEEHVACSLKCNKRLLNANVSKIRFNNTETLYQF